MFQDRLTLAMSGQDIRIICTPRIQNRSVTIQKTRRPPPLRCYFCVKIYAKKYLFIYEKIYVSIGTVARERNANSGIFAVRSFGKLAFAFGHRKMRWWFTSRTNGHTTVGGKIILFASRYFSPLLLIFSSCKLLNFFDLIIMIFLFCFDLYVDVPINLARGKRGCVGASVQNRVLLQWQRPDRTHSKHRFVASNQKEFQQKSYRLFYRRIWQPRNGHVPDGSAKFHAELCRLLSDLISVASERSVNLHLEPFFYFIFIYISL